MQAYLGNFLKLKQKALIFFEIKRGRKENEFNSLLIYKIVDEFIVNNIFCYLFPINDDRRRQIVDVSV